MRPGPTKQCPLKPHHAKSQTTTIATAVCACPCYESSVCTPVRQVAGFIPDKLHHVVFLLCCCCPAHTANRQRKCPLTTSTGCVKSALYMQQHLPIAVWHSLAACCCKQPVLSKGQVPLHKPRMPLQFTHAALPAAYLRCSKTHAMLPNKPNLGRKALYSPQLRVKTRAATQSPSRRDRVTTGCSARRLLLAPCTSCTHALQ